jgi:hypothetical protein
MKINDLCASDVQMRMVYSDQTFASNTFCLSVAGDLELNPEICRDEKTNKKFKSVFPASHLVAVSSNPARVYLGW